MPASAHTGGRKPITSRHPAPRFYVVSGSHGVGKTTVTALVHQVLADHGVATSTFHHRADKASAASTPQSDRTGPPGWKRRLWRVLPVSLRAWLVAANDELRYSRSVARRITSAASQGQAAIIDRYVYDRLVDLRLHNRPRQQVWAVEIACRLMRKPDMTFFLIDSPERIHARKDELSVEQITEYQSALKSLFMRLRIPHLEIEIDGREAVAVAESIAAFIEHAGPADSGLPDAAR